MTTKTKVSIALPFLVLALAGCEEPQRRVPTVSVAAQTVTIEDLAARLGLQVEERTNTFVVLKNAANTVLIFTHPDGRVFVNGKAVGPVGTAERVGHTVRVPTALASQIAPHLRLSEPQPPVATPVPEPAPRPRPPGGPVVVIDAGHGGQDPGAISSTGVYEKTINLRVAAKVARLLEPQGLTVVMTRWQDRFIELEERAALANRRHADLFVSIHADSAPNRSARGFTVYVATGAAPPSYRAAQAIRRALSATGSDSRGVRTADYQVLVQTACPAVLVELGYLSNAQDAARLRDGDYQDRLAQALTAGILACLR